ncbi:sodium:proton antiporter [bacterium SCN 62-11]|nr:cation:proton antiporter [Candidatus Eremiobacteraeota bacterium]ODT59879.1 MAG: sodium:proton antiporter [bacterium SCN 62-11]
MEQLLILFVAAVALAAAARRLGAPYPVFLALGGAALAFCPGGPSLSVPPELALALFVAPVLLDAAFDTSIRDLREEWAAVAALVIFAVGCTTLAVALVVKGLMPAVAWPAALALGAVVAPPDAVAATAVLRPLKPPQRILTILEGESLLNDATALLIYRLAVHGTSAPALLVTVPASLLAGVGLGWLTIRLLARIQHIPTAIIMQFVTTFGVWMGAEHAGLSGVLVTVAHAVTVARTAPQLTPARSRIPSYAVWDTVVFAVNILAFIFIGLQIRPILEALDSNLRLHYFGVALAVLVTVIAVRFAWHMSFNAVVRWRHRRFGFHPTRPTLRPTVGSGLLISWAGMRGIVTLAAAMALPAAFPDRGLIVFTSFAVVLGTLTLQGLTLKPLLKRLDLQDGDPVGQEVETARQRALEAALQRLEQDASPMGDLVRREFEARLGSGRKEDGELRRGALRQARQALLELRTHQQIGDDAFHHVEEELDWLEMADRSET